MPERGGETGDTARGLLSGRDDPTAFVSGPFDELEMYRRQMQGLADIPIRYLSPNDRLRPWLTEDELNAMFGDG